MKLREHSSIIIGIIALGIVIGIASAANTDTVTIDINVSYEVSVDINPNSTAWYGLGVGTTSSPKPFQIQNVGSVNISTIDASITNADTNPYGGQSAALHNAGDFILLNSTNNATFYYINKIDWNESVPNYITTPTDWTEGPNRGYFGRIRTVSDDDVGQEYFWFTNMTNGTGGGNCSTDGRLLIANHPRTVTDTGDTDFTNSGNYTAIDLTASDGYTTGEGEIPSSHPLAGYCVQVSADCSTVKIFHFNKDLDDGDGTSVCSSDQYVYNGTLEPGDTTEIWLEAKIPLGVAEGDVSAGTLTITASA